MIVLRRFRPRHAKIPCCGRVRRWPKAGFPRLDRIIEIFFTLRQIIDAAEQSKWAWMRWRKVLDHDMLRAAAKRDQDGKLKLNILSRAKDKGGNLQEDCAWNLRGVAYNGYGEVRDVVVALE